MAQENIADDEFIIRRMSEVKFRDGRPVATGINRQQFKLRRNEVGLSVNREVLMKPEDLLKQPGILANSAVARAKVGDIRKLGLEVIDVPVENNPGHCEIHPVSTNLEDPEVRDKLAQLFAFVD